MVAERRRNGGSGDDEDDSTAAELDRLWTHVKALYVILTLLAAGWLTTTFLGFRQEHRSTAVALTTSVGSGDGKGGVAVTSDRSPAPNEAPRQRQRSLFNVTLTGDGDRVEKLYEPIEDDGRFDVTRRRTTKRRASRQAVADDVQPAAEDSADDEGPPDDEATSTTDEKNKWVWLTSYSRIPVSVYRPAASSRLIMSVNGSARSSETK